MDSVSSSLLLLLSLAGQELEKRRGRSQRDELAAAVVPESSQGIFHGFFSEGQIWPRRRRRHLLGAAASPVNMLLTLTTSSLIISSPWWDLKVVVARFGVIISQPSGRKGRWEKWIDGRVGPSVPFLSTDNFCLEDFFS